MTDILDNNKGGAGTGHSEKNDRQTPEESRRMTAVALKKFGVDAAVLPKIVAAGYGKLAEEIIALAFQNGVNVREDRALAEMLAAIELDSEIPSEALIAVAEVLTYVYKANGTYQSGDNGEKTND